MVSSSTKNQYYFDSVWLDWILFEAPPNAKMVMQTHYVISSVIIVESQMVE